jgi:uncharacterized membrane protein
MFCPKCGAEDSKASQFCRACGAELQVVRTALERPDSITSSAITAREEIGIAIASKIKEFESAHDLRRAVYELLPAIERFLESPEERRLHREERRLKQIREGVVTCAVGIAIALLFLVLGSFKTRIVPEDILVILSLVGLGVLLIGLGIVVNGIFFTTQKKRPGGASMTMPNRLLGGEDPAGAPQQKTPNTQPTFPPSVTEGTTRGLDNV